MPDWRSIILRGVESDELDYKAAQNWHDLPRAGKAKFVRHCLAMANTKGGYVVVGVGENAAGKPELFTGLTEEQAASFDPTIVGNFVNRCADPAIDFTVERPVVDGKQYVVFDIRRFANIPHVCATSCDSELMQGVFYIRTGDASSRPAYRASEIHAIVQRALRNQRELLGRMLKGILFGDHAQDNYAKGRFQEEVLHSRTYFDKHLRKSPENILLDVTLTPDEYIPARFSLPELKRCATDAITGLPEKAAFILPTGITEAYFTNVSLRRCSESGTRGWQIYRSGLFHCHAVLGTTKFILGCGELTGLISECVFFLYRLYSYLGYSSELLVLKVEMRQVEDKALADDSGIYFCRIPVIEYRKETSVSEMSRNLSAATAAVVANLSDRFNCPERCHAGLTEKIAELQHGYGKI